MYLDLNRWYLQTFRSTSEHLYFLGDVVLKNHKIQGLLIEIDPEHPRRHPHVKRASVHPKLDFNLWREVPSSAVPNEVLVAARKADAPHHGDAMPARDPRKLNVFEQHELKIARDTLRMPDAIAGVLGGMTKAQARRVIEALSVHRHGDARPARQPYKPVAERLMESLAPVRQWQGIKLTTPGGRIFTLGRVEHSRERPPRDSFWSDTWRILYEGKPAGSLSRNLNYGTTADGKPRWQGSLRELVWSGPLPPTGIGFDVSAFDTPTEALAAWGHNADQVLDWRAGKPVRSIYSKTGVLQRGSKKNVPAPFWQK